MQQTNQIEEKDKKNGMDPKALVGYALGAVALVTLIGACFNIGLAYWLNILLLIFGGLLGWTGGILATPRNEKEKAQFSNYAAGISTFLSGFLVAKLDKLFELAIAEQLTDNIIFGQGLIFGSAFLLGALFTFIGRNLARVPR
jgi:hypothetical protein